MQDELVRTREALLKATQEISLLRAENVRMRARLDAFGEIDTDRIFAIVDQVNLELAESQERADKMAAALREQFERGNLLQILLEEQEATMRQIRSRVNKDIEKIDELAAVEGVESLKNEEGLQALRDQIQDLSETVNSAAHMIEHLHDDAVSDVARSSNDEVSRLRALSLNSDQSARMVESRAALNNIISEL